MQTKSLTASLTGCTHPHGSNGSLPILNEDARLAKQPVRQIRVQTGDRWRRLASLRTATVALAAVAVLMLLQLTPLGTLQCALRKPSRDAQRRLWFQRLSTQPHGPGAALAAGAQAVLQQLGDVRDKVGLQPRHGSHIIVAASTNADETRWLDEQLSNVTSSRVYVVEHDAAKRQHCQQLTAQDATAAVAAGCWPHLATGSGREASVYLQYIVEEWDRLPESILFIHGHEKSWHRLSPEVFADSVQRMRWGEVAFGSLRTWGMLRWNFWDLAIMISPTEPERCRDEQRNAPEWWKRCEEQGRRLQWSWERLGLNETLGLLPFEVHAPGCCAEFVVRRDRIRARPRSFYTDLLDRLNSIPPHEPAPAFALEHSWHAIFGEPWVTLGIGKCRLVHCSEEETQDLHNWPPRVNHPYRYNRLPDVDRVPHP